MVRVTILAVLEPQASGSWHLHCLIKKKDGKFPFIDNNETLEPMWRQGFTNIKKLKDSDNIAAYLMAYLTNVPKDEIIPGTKDKAIIKGARLHFYPSGVHIYRTSRGIRIPKKLEGSKQAILKEYGLSVNEVADAAFFHEHHFSDDRTAKFVTEFYDNVGNKKEANHGNE